MRRSWTVEPKEKKRLCVSNVDENENGNPLHEICRLQLGKQQEKKSNGTTAMTLSKRATIAVSTFAESKHTKWIHVTLCELRTVDIRSTMRSRSDKKLPPPPSQITARCGWRKRCVLSAAVSNSAFDCKACCSPLFAGDIISHFWGSHKHNRNKHNEKATKTYGCLRIATQYKLCWWGNFKSDLHKCHLSWSAQILFKFRLSLAVARRLNKNVLETPAAYHTLTQIEWICRMYIGRHAVLSAGHWKYIESKLNFQQIAFADHLCSNDIQNCISCCWWAGRASHEIQDFLDLHRRHSCTCQPLSSASCWAKFLAPALVRSTSQDRFDIGRFGRHFNRRLS